MGQGGRAFCVEKEEISGGGDGGHEGDPAENGNGKREG